MVNWSTAELAGRRLWAPENIPAQTTNSGKIIVKSMTTYRRIYGKIQNKSRFSAEIMEQN